MKIQFLVDKNDYKKLLIGINFVAKNGNIVKNESHKIKGKTNYILTLSSDKKNIASAKALSEIRIHIENKFNDKNIKFRVLIDEALQFFATSLYPLACDFEIKLRSLIYMILFDIDEQANIMAVEKYKKTVIKADNKMVELPKNDFLAHLTFEEIFNFLFDNNSFIEAAKAVISQTGKAYNRRITKAEILKSIESVEEQTIWKVLFEPLFPNSVIPDIHEKIHEYRNMIMHVRDIDYTNYDKIKQTYKKGIRDLEHNLAKESVADDSKSNIGLLAKTLTLFFYQRMKIMQNIDYEKILSALEKVSDTQKHLAALAEPISISYIETASRISELQKKLSKVQVDPDVFDKMQELQNKLSKPIINLELSDENNETNIDDDTSDD